MKYPLIIFLSTLPFVFFKANAIDRELATNTGGTTYKCTYRGAEARIKFSEISQCQAVAETGLIEQEYKPSPRNGFSPYAPIEDSICDIRTVVQDSIYSIECRQKFGSTRHNEDGTSDTDNYTVRANATMNSPEQSPDTWQCLNPDFPNGPIEAYGTYYCEQSEQPPLTDPDCPYPTENDPFVFGTGGGQTSVCFPVDNGRLCEIKTDSQGGYYIPISFGSLEPVACVPDPEPEPEPETPDPDKTPDPDERPAPEDTDPSTSPDSIGALNKVNKNLDSINNNMVSGFESNDERLDRLAKETQNSNDLLSSIKSNTFKSNNTLSDIKNGQSDGNKLLEKIEENTEPENFNFSASRKQGGLNSVFTDADIQQVKTEIEEKRTELTDYLETIKTESATLFYIDPNLSTEYEERLKTIKGVEVDLGVSRFSNFFKLIAPAILLAATLTGLYILLGSNRE